MTTDIPTFEQLLELVFPDPDIREEFRRLAARLVAGAETGEDA